MYGVCKEYEFKLKRDELCESKKLKCCLGTASTDHTRKKFQVQPSILLRLSEFYNRRNIFQ
jgi:hypothetical protein